MKPNLEKLRPIYDFMREANYRHEIIARSHTVNGNSIRSYEPLNVHRIDNEDLLSHLREDIEDGEVIYDIGANVGTHSLVLTAEHNVDIKAFEPNPKVFDWLRANIRATDSDKRTDTFHLGISNQDGVLQMRLSHRQSTFEVEGSPVCDASAIVPVCRLDMLVTGGLTPPDRIKIDTEGHEQSVIKGAEETLREYGPTIYCETHSNRDTVRTSLKEMGYEVGEFSDYLKAVS